MPSRHTHLVSCVLYALISTAPTLHVWLDVHVSLGQQHRYCRCVLKPSGAAAWGGGGLSAAVGSTTTQPCVMCSLQCSRVFPFISAASPQCQLMGSVMGSFGILVLLVMIGVELIVELWLSVEFWSAHA